jgi:hypothetical protein
VKEREYREERIVCVYFILLLRGVVGFRIGRFLYKTELYLLAVY